MKHMILSLKNEQQRLIQDEVDWLEGVGWSDYIRQVNKLSLVNGIFFIDVTSSKYSQESVADVAWDIVVQRANGVADTKGAILLWIAEGNQQSGQFIFHLLVRDDADRYRYESETTYDTFVGISKKEIDREEWVIAANAGFR